MTPDIKRKQIGQGDAAILETVKKIRTLSRRDARTPDAKALATSIRKKTAQTWSQDPARARLEQARQAFQWVVENITYKFDHEHVRDYVDVKDPKDTELVIAPKYYLSEHISEGDCDDMTACLASILGALGFHVRLKIIAHRSDSFSHIYLEAMLPTATGDMWIPLDPVVGAKGFAWEKAPIIRKQTFEVF